MKRSTTFARFLGWNLALILFWVLLTAPVEAGSRWPPQRAVGTAPGDSDPASPLVAAPTLQWHTFMGGSNNEWGKGIAMDGGGNAYVTGFSYATWGTPVNAHAGGKDAFIAKLNPSGARQFHTFLGSADDDDGNAIAVDGSGNLYVAGTSDTTWGSPIDPFIGDFPNGFVAKLAATVRYCG